MDPDRAIAVNEHLGLAFDHLREAIMLALAGDPAGTPSDAVGGALGRLERFVASGGDTNVLLEGMGDEPLSKQEMEEAATVLEGLFDNDEFSKKVEPDPDQDNQAVEMTQEEAEDAEDDEFSGLFDDIDEDDNSDDGPSDAPAAF